METEQVCVVIFQLFAVHFMPHGAPTVESDLPSSSVVFQSSRFLLSHLPPLFHDVKLVIFGIHGKLRQIKTLSVGGW